jgi:hypothetical protein
VNDRYIEELKNKGTFVLSTSINVAEPVLKRARLPAHNDTAQHRIDKISCARWDALDILALSVTPCKGNIAL